MTNLTVTLKVNLKRALYNNIILSLLFNEQIFSNVLLPTHISLTNVQEQFINHTKLNNFNYVKRKKQTVSLPRMCFCRINKAFILTKQTNNELSTSTTQH